MTDSRDTVQRRTAASAPPKGEKVRATPLVRRLAAELGVDLAGVTGTGPQGRITEEDVRAAVFRTCPVTDTETGPKGHACRCTASGARCSST